MMLLAVRRLMAGTIILVLAAPCIFAQTWTGLGGDNKWATAGNWDAGVPGSGSTALFNGAGNGVTAISLNGGIQPINTIQFDPGSAAYTIGQVAGDTLSTDSNGFVIANNNLTTAQTI